MTKKTFVSFLSSISQKCDKTWILFYSLIILTRFIIFTTNLEKSLNCNLSIIILESLQIQSTILKKFLFWVSVFWAEY